MSELEGYDYGSYNTGQAHHRSTFILLALYKALYQVTNFLLGELPSFA